MRPNPDHSLQTTLPGDLERIDAALAELAARESAPAGMTERVYSASVQLLPHQLRLRGRATSPASPQRMRLCRPVWGQLAMAASIGIAFVLAAWFLATPRNAQEHGGMIAENSTGHEPTVRTIAHHSAPLSPEAEWLLLESGFNGRSAAHLAETRDLSFSDLQSESERFFNELEL